MMFQARQSTKSMSRSPPRREVRREAVRLRTFPSETCRRILATQALAIDSPRALLKDGGCVGQLPSVCFGSFSDGEESSLSGSSDEEMAKGKKRRKKKNSAVRRCFVPSKGQVAHTISKCLPRQDAAQFEDVFKLLQSEKGCPSDCDNRDVDPNALVTKTRVVSILWALQRVYGVDNVTCRGCDHMNGDQPRNGEVVSRRHYLEIVVMDAILSRTTKAPRRVTGKEEVDTPVKYRVGSADLLEDKFDLQYSALVAIVPDGATYYCHRERRNAFVGVLNEPIAMDTSWLRVVKNAKVGASPFAGGGYVSKLRDGQPFWKFGIARGKSNFQLTPIPKLPIMRLSWNKSPLPMRKVISAYQCTDESGPCLPPDVIEGKQYDVGKEMSHLRRAYREAMNRSTSAKRGCRWYAKNHLHRNIDPTKTLVIDAKDGDMDICVFMQIERGGVTLPDGRDVARVGLARESVVQIRDLKHLGYGAQELLSDIQKHARSVFTNGKKSARVGLGDEGSMYPAGSRIMKDNVRRRRYVTSAENAVQQKLLRQAVIASARLAAVTVPGVLRIIQDGEDDGGIPPPKGGMNGDGDHCRISHSMDISVDLSNASHYDVNDASQGFSIWTEDVPGSTTDWYFVLPNVYGKRASDDDHGNKKGDMYQGVAIRLTHGVLISWDGRVIRHCTSLMKRERDCHVFGTFFAAKSSVVAYGARVSFLKEAKRRMQMKRARRKARRARKRRRKGGDATASGGNPVVMPVEPSGCDTTTGDVKTDLFSIPIPRKGGVDESVAREDEGLLVGVPSDDASDISEGADEVDEDGQSWSNHDYASEVDDSGSCDSGVFVGSPDDGVPDNFLERAVIDVDATAAEDTSADVNADALPVDATAVEDTSADVNADVLPTTDAREERSEELDCVVRSLQPWGGDSVLLVDVEKRSECHATCNMMCNLQNSQWLPDFHVHDPRFAHPETVHRTRRRSWEQALTRPVTSQTISKFRVDGACNGELEGFGKEMLAEVLGWVHCILCNGRHVFMYPCQVSTRFLGDVKTITVPCQHLQLYFQVMMGYELRHGESIAVGYRTVKGKLRYYVERVETRTTLRALPTWELNDCVQHGLFEFWDRIIYVDYFESTNNQFMEVKDRGAGNVGVAEHTIYETSIRNGFTPAQFLRCSYLRLVHEDTKTSEFALALKKALLKRMPTNADIVVTLTHRNDIGQKFHIIQPNWPSFATGTIPDSGSDSSRGWSTD